MDIHNLKCFVSVVEEGSILKASSKLHMAQPPLSRMMKDLENELNTKLFDRGKRITLTPTGKLLYDRALLILDLEENTRKDITSLKQINELTINLGIISSSTSLLYNNSISLFHKKYPDVHLNIKEANTFQLIELLNQKIIDLAIVRTPFDDSNFKATFLKKEPMVLLSKNKIFSESINFKELDGLPIIIYRRFKNTFINLFKKYDIKMNISAEVDDAKTVILLSSCNIGCGIVPLSASYTFKHLNLYSSIINEKSLDTSLGIIYRKNEEPKAVCQSLINILINDNMLY